MAKSIADEKEAKDRRRVRKDQDVEYLQSLQKDKQRREEEEALQRQQELAKLEEEEAKVLALAKQASLVEMFKEEPAQGSQITLHFPSGERLSRRFDPTDTVSRVRDFVNFSRLSLPGVPEEYDLVQLPKTVLADDSLISIVAPSGRALLYIISKE